MTFCHIIVVCKEQTLDLNNNILQLYSINTYHNGYYKSYALNFINIEDSKLSLRSYPYFIKKKLAALKKYVGKSYKAKKKSALNILQ